MNRINFVFCVHNHQPVGNFDFVLEDAFSRAYLPFLETLARHPSIKIVLHVSGALLEWMELHRPEYLDLLRVLVSQGQLEMMTGGFYEPILPSVPDEDKIGQTKKLTSFLKERLDVRAKGLWLAERVWEPSLASSIAKAGVEYTVVDDSHFKSAGLAEHELLGCYLTEDQGSVLRIFSGSKRLRYLIPFADPVETLDYLRSRASDKKGTLLVFADDGEKFGIWPGTYKLCYEEKWLERFFRALEENEDWLKIVTFSEYASRNRPLGWVFLPTASYAEMMEWCLPVEAQLKYQGFLDKLKARGEFEEYESFVKGGFWRNFLSRYPESNWMYKRMLFARRRIILASSREPGEEGTGLRHRSARKKSPENTPILDEAMNEVWRAQCNCAYWHGVFGGLYLPHLREAIYRHIIRAEKTAERVSGPKAESPEVERINITGEGGEEIVLSNAKMTCFVSPSTGGTVVEIDDRVREINLVNTLARRPEAYHHRMKAAAGHQSGGKAASIHDAIVTKETRLEEFLFYDKFPRTCLVDHFLSPRTSLKDIIECRFEELGSFAAMPYVEKRAAQSSSVILNAAGTIREAREAVELRIEKTLSMPPGKASLQVSYDLSFEKDITEELLFAPELNLLIPSGHGAHGQIEIDRARPQDFELSRSSEFHRARELTLLDANVGLAVLVSLETPCMLWQFPVETVSLSEGGLERIYQGTCIMAAWMLPASARHAHFGFSLNLENPSNLVSPDSVRHGRGCKGEVRR